MKKGLQTISKYIVAYSITVLFLFGLIVGSATIPDSLVQPQFERTGEYLCERIVRYLLVDFVQASRIDRYADCVTLAIANYLDDDHPVESAMWASYYGDTSSSMNKYLLEGARNHPKANQEYLRYWHGSAAVLRIMHLFWNVKEIYLFNACLMAVLFLILLFMLIRKKYYGESIALILSMIIVSVWYVPLCLEYTYTFLCMLAASIIAICIAYKEKYDWLGVFFLVNGMVTVYFDFLTTETLTLLIPLLLILRIRQRQRISNGKEEWIISAKSCFAWGIGYMGMWSMKWILASIILGQNVMPYVIGHIEERIGGDVGLSLGQYLIKAVVKNLKCLFPWEYGIFGSILVFLVIVIFVVIPTVMGCIELKKCINQTAIALYAALGLIPFVRFLVLHNHSYYHSSFTYRALASTVVAICMIILELVDIIPRKEVENQ